MGAQPIPEAGDPDIESPGPTWGPGLGSPRDFAGYGSTRARTHLATSLAFASGWKSSNTS